jgi:hypothetical protein
MRLQGERCDPLLPQVVDVLPMRPHCTVCSCKPQCTLVCYQLCLSELSHACTFSEDSKKEGKYDYEYPGCGALFDPEALSTLWRNYVDQRTALKQQVVKQDVAYMTEERESARFSTLLAREVCSVWERGAEWPDCMYHQVLDTDGSLYNMRRDSYREGNSQVECASL